MVCKISINPGIAKKTRKNKQLGRKPNDVPAHTAKTEAINAAARAVYDVLKIYTQVSGKDRDRKNSNTGNK